MPIKEAQDASCASLACPRKGNAGCGGWHKDNTAFLAWVKQRNENTVFLDTTPSPRGEGGERSEPDRVLAV